MSEPRELKGDWWTAPAEADDGRTILVTGRRDVARFRSNPRYSIRIELTWSYEGNAEGMPDRATSELMEQVQDALAVDVERAHTADAFATVAVKNDRLFVAVHELLVEHVEHLEE